MAVGEQKESSQPGVTGACSRVPLQMMPPRSPIVTPLAVYPGGAHGFTLFPNDLSKAATAKMDDFLNRVLA